MNAPDSPPPRRWPWILLVLAVLGVALAIVGLRREIERVKEIKALNPPRSALSTSAFACRGCDRKWRTVPLWNAVTGHRFFCRAALAARQSRVQRLDEILAPPCWRRRQVAGPKRRELAALQKRQP